MRTLTAIVAITLLAGCSSIATTLLPSLNACEEVAYYRKGDTAAIQAACKVR